MSLCDKCFDPGACCRRLFFTRPNEGDVSLTIWDDDDPAEFLTKTMGANPFYSIGRHETRKVPEDAPDHAGRSYSVHAWACSALGPDGRCKIYADRPQLCRDFEPASTPLCVHFMGAESDERSILP